MKHILIIVMNALILISITVLFPKNLYIENIYYSLLAATIIYILNNTIKPTIVRITIPIIALTLGLFYPLINILIIKITQIILKQHIKLTGSIIMIFIISIIIEITNNITKKIIGGKI